MQNIVKMDYEDVYKSFQQIDLQDSLKKKKKKMWQESAVSSTVNFPKCSSQHPHSGHSGLHTSVTPVPECQTLPVHSAHK